MALDVSGLPAYVDQNSDKLISLSVVGSVTGKYCAWQTGVKGSAALQLFETDAVFQADSGCGWNASGTTTITQATITVAPIKVQENICISDLEGKWAQHLLKSGSNDANGVAPAFEEALFTQKALKISKQNELALWQGDTGSGTSYMARFNGWLKILKALGYGGAGDPVRGNPATGGGWTQLTTTDGITSSNVLSIVKKVNSLIPEDILDKDDLFIGMSWANYRIWAQAMIDANLFHYQVDQTKGESFLPGTNVKVMAIPGLKGMNDIVAGSWANFYAGTDMMDEADKMSFEYAKEAQTWRFEAKWKLGAQVAFPAEVVLFELVAP